MFDALEPECVYLHSETLTFERSHATQQCRMPIVEVVHGQEESCETSQEEGSPCEKTCQTRRSEGGPSDGPAEEGRSSPCEARRPQEGSRRGGEAQSSPESPQEGKGRRRSDNVDAVKTPVGGRTPHRGGPAALGARPGASRNTLPCLELWAFVPSTPFL